MTEWDIKKLRILRTLAEQGTVTATAEALHMTPSAVSQQLTNLARQLGVALLEAQGRRVRLTDAAHLVLRHAEAVFAELERADAELAGYLAGDAGEVRIGAFSTAVPALVVPAVAALRRSHPGWRSGSGRRRRRSRTSSCRPAAWTWRSHWRPMRRPRAIPGSPG